MKKMAGRDYEDTLQVELIRSPRYMLHTSPPEY